MDAEVPAQMKGPQIPERGTLWEEWPSWVILAGIWAFSLWAWPRLPAQVAVHWGVDGRPNGWATPREAALLMPALLTGVYALTLLFFNARFDFRAARLMDPALTRRIRFLVVCLLAAIQGLILGVPLRGGTMMGTIAFVPVGIFLVLFGNLMPRLEPNAWAGIRIPPTLEDRTVWKRTHRLAGRLFVTGGLLQLLACLLPEPLADWVFMALFVPMILIPVVYAYRIRPI